MKQQYEHTYLYVLLIYIVKLKHNNEYIFLSLIFEMEISCVSNTTFLIHKFQFLTNIPRKKIIINEISFILGHTAIG